MDTVTSSCITDKIINRNKSEDARRIEEFAKINGKRSWLEDER